MKPIRKCMCSSLVAIFILSTFGQNALGQELVWKQQIFERYSNDEDIKNILRNIILQNGNEVAFLTGVEGKITYRFANMPLQGAFNMLLAQNGLLYSFDSAANTVTFGPEESMLKERLRLAPLPKNKPDFISPQSPVEYKVVKRAAPTPQPTVELVPDGIDTVRLPLNSVDGGKVMGAAKRFGLGGDISITNSGRELIVKGTRREQAQVRELVTALEAAKIAKSALAQTGIDPTVKGNEATVNAVDRPSPQHIPTAQPDREKTARLPVPTLTPQILSPESTPSQKARMERSSKNPPLDVSDKYRLSGIAKLGPGAKIAFIDGKDYEIGDLIGTMRIVEILDASVELEEENTQGKKRYVINFPAPSKVSR